MILALILAGAVFIADSSLHYLTSTIVFDRISINSTPEKEFGYGLSKQCLDLDRVKDNAGFPCTLPLGIGFDDPDATEHYNEISRLQANLSTSSQIRLTGADGVGEDIALMIPNPATLAAEEDFRASTIGVGMSCGLVPPALCDMRAVGNMSTLAAFNCSDNFFGVLGKNPNISSVDGTKAEDPDLSPLAFKPSANLQFAYFTDANLDSIWNPESWDPNTNQPDELNPLPDDKLLNPFYVGFATSMATTTFVNGSEMADSDLVFDSDNYIGYFIMSCSMTSYLVDYTWYKSSIRNVTATKSPNGTLLELFHGNQVYNTVSGGAWDLQQYLINAAIAGNTTGEFLSKWQNQFSVKALSHIGGQLTARTNLLEQKRESLLVAKVPKAVLGVLVGCSLLYTVLGIALVVAAYRASTEDVHAVAEQLSLAGLTNMAFGDAKDKATPSAGRTPHPSTPDDNGDYFNNQPLSRTEARKVRINGADFQVWV
jgi:hypothetical protein